ncbi:unnamed protein product, partial [Tenebrio molitor]
RLLKNKVLEIRLIHRLKVQDCTVVDEHVDKNWNFERKSSQLL